MSVTNFFWAKNLKDSVFKYGHISSKNIFGKFLSSGDSNFSSLIPADFQDKILCRLALSISKYSYS